MLFTVIVPIYKVENYLCECIDSILSQNYYNFELILVDDGSPDRCPEICEQYARQDKRIRIVHQQNRGLSSARNRGIEISCGRYIVFVDGDDVLCDNTLKKLAECVEKNNYPDMIIGNVVHWINNTEKIAVDNQKYMKEQIGKNIFELNEIYAKHSVQLPWSAYHSIYNRELLIKQGLYFSEDIVGAEDCDFYLKILPYIRTYVLTDIPLVKYRLNREGSIINTTSFRSIMGQLRVFSNAFDFAVNFSNQYLIRRYFADRFTNMIIFIETLKEETQKEECYCFIHEHKIILKYTSFKIKYIVAKTVWKVCGVEKGSKLLLKINKRIHK